MIKGINEIIEEFGPSKNNLLIELQGLSLDERSKSDEEILLDEICINGDIDRLNSLFFKRALSQYSEQFTAEKVKLSIYNGHISFAQRFLEVLQLMQYEPDHFNPTTLLNYCESLKLRILPLLNKMAKIYAVDALEQAVMANDADRVNRLLEIPSVRSGISQSNFVDALYLAAVYHQNNLIIEKLLLKTESFSLEPKALSDYEEKRAAYAAYFLSALESQRRNLPLSQPIIHVLNATLLSKCKEESCNIKMMLEIGGDIQAVDTDGNTALHLASMRGDILCCTQLIQAGAKIDAKNNDGKMAWTLLEDPHFISNSYFSKRSQKVLSSHLLSEMNQKFIEYLGSDQPCYFKKLHKANVVMQLAAILLHPWRMDQGIHQLCGPASLFHLLADKSPLTLFKEMMHFCQYGKTLDENLIKYSAAFENDTNIFQAFIKSFKNTQSLYGYGWQMCPQRYDIFFGATKPKNMVNWLTLLGFENIHECIDFENSSGNSLSFIHRMILGGFHSAKHHFLSSKSEKFDALLKEKAANKIILLSLNRPIIKLAERKKADPETLLDVLIGHWVYVDELFFDENTKEVSLSYFSWGEYFTITYPLDELLEDFQGFVSATIPPHLSYVMDQDIEIESDTMDINDIDEYKTMVVSFKGNPKQHLQMHNADERDKPNKPSSSLKRPD